MNTRSNNFVGNFYAAIGALRLVSQPTLPHFLLFLYFCVCTLFLVDFLPVSWSNDAAMVVGMASGDILGEESGSYYLTAQFFGWLGGNSLIFILIVGYFWAREVSVYWVSLKSGVFLVALTTPGMLMGMIRPQKDVFVGVLVTIVLYTLRRFYGKAGVFCSLLVFIYIVYGFIMRPYYVLIISIFLLIVLVERNFRYWPLIFVFVVFFMTVLLSPEQMTMLQGARDEVNYFRTVDDEQRTAFGNLYPYVDSVFKFWANYFNAFFYLNFPIFYFFDMQAMFLQSYTLVCLWFLFYSIAKSGPGWCKYSIFLFLSSFLFYPIFEPDLGSYTRHISLAAAYLSPIVMVFGSDSRVL